MSISITAQVTDSLGAVATATATASQSTGATFDSVNNFPFMTPGAAPDAIKNNRPYYNSSTKTLTWVGPSVSGGDSSTNAAGASTTADVAHSLQLAAPTAALITSSAAGQVFVGLNIVGANQCLQINHANCQVLRSNITASGTSAGGYPGTIVLGSGGTGLLIEDCVLNSNCNANQQTSIINTGSCANPALTVRRCTIQQGEKGIGVAHTNSVYVDNYFWNFVGGDCDMVQVYESGAGGNNLGPCIVQHNTFDGQNNQFSTTNDSCINCSTWGMSDVVGNNRINNFSFIGNACGLPSYCGHQVLFDMRTSQSLNGTITNMTVTNNAFYGAAAYFSAHQGNNAAPGPTFTANSGNYIASQWPPQQGNTSAGLINGTGAI